MRPCHHRRPRALRPRAISLLVIWLSLCAMPALALDLPVESRFDSDLEGWTIEGSDLLTWGPDGSRSAGVYEDGDAAALLRVLPNPARDRIRLFFDDVGGTCRMSIMDARGRSVRRPVERGSGWILLDRRDDHGRRLSPRIYFVRVETPTGAVTAKLALQP